MAGSVVIQSSFRAQSVVQLDRFVARIQPLALLPPLCFIAPEILYRDLNFPSGATKSITWYIKNGLVSFI